MEFSMPLDEAVLCIPRGHLDFWGSFQGFRKATEPEMRRLLDPSQFSFRPRSECETDPNYKQLIPYLVLRSGDQFFHYSRGAAGTEKRLQSKRSLGIGGHISEADAAGGVDPYRTGMMRELTEEVELGSLYNERFLGFINDDRTPVGAVHLGVVHLFDLEQPLATSRESALADAGFAPLAELIPNKEQFETWSQFVFDTIG
jgi:predicted NUDIX family phosphoesterase